MGKLLSMNTWQRVLCASALAMMLTAGANAETLDFEGIGTIPGPPFNLVTMGYTLEEIPSPGSPEPIIRPASLSPNGTDVYAICGFCAPTAGFKLYRNDGARFGLISIDLGGLGNAADAFDFSLTGFTPAGGTVTETSKLDCARRYANNFAKRRLAKSDQRYGGGKQCWQRGFFRICL